MNITRESAGTLHGESKLVPNSFPLTQRQEQLRRLERQYGEDLAETSQGINLTAEERKKGCTQKGILYKLEVRVEEEVVCRLSAPQSSFHLTRKRHTKF
jgi:hypothetical protein